MSEPRVDRVKMSGLWVRLRAIRGRDATFPRHAGFAWSPMSALPLLPSSLATIQALALVFLAGVLAIPLLAFAANEESVDIPAEVARLSQELAAVNIREGLCLQAASVQGTVSTSSSSGSYESGSVSTFDSRSSTSRSRDLGSRTRSTERSFSSTYRNAGAGSSDSSSSSSYSTPDMRAAACRDQAESFRDGILASVRLADTDPKEFTAIVRERRVRERAERAHWVALFEQSRPAMRHDLDVLASAPPHKVGLEAFAGCLDSLQRRLISLWIAAPAGIEHFRTFEAVNEAIRAFSVARDRWVQGEGATDEVTRLEEALQVIRQRLAKSPSSPVVQAEVDVYEHNLRRISSQVERAAKQSEAAWRNALPAANAALSGLAK